MFEIMAGLARLLLPDGKSCEIYGSCSLGRGSKNTVVLANNQISRKHAIIQFQGENEFWIVDLGSSNGTFVNGRRVMRPQPLCNGDVIDMAGSKITFLSDGSTSQEDSAHSYGSTILSVSCRNCWLMVADIVGSTRMAQELPPERVPLITGGWFKTCREIIEEHDGHMNQYLGDGFFCYWEDYPKSVPRILDALRQLEMLQKSASPAFRVVMHYGMIVLGSVPTIANTNLHGPDVNFVFRMEKLAGSWGDDRLCSEPAWKALGVPSLTTRESEVSGYDGIHRFHVPDLG